MNLRLAPLTLLTAIAVSTPALAQQGQRYAAPRTEFGQPDFQGFWITGFITPFERPPGVDNLVATPEQVKNLGPMIRSKMPVLVDPDVAINDLKQLALVKGEYRTSMIVDPPDGKMPYSKAGTDLAAKVGVRNSTGFDGPEQRPLSERCMESLTWAPIRTVPVILPIQFVQTRNDIVIFSEGPVGMRVVHLGGQLPPASMRTDAGYSTGRWEGDTLVVET